MRFEIDTVQRLYKTYHRIHIYSNEGELLDFLDTEADELKQLQSKINEHLGGD